MTWRDRLPWYLAAGAGGVLGASLLLLRAPAPETRLHAIDARGIVAANPAGLARAAGVELDVYVLASTMQSEESTDRARLAVGRAIWNSVRGDRRKLVKKLIPSGRLGIQREYAATHRPPTARTLSLAEAVVAGRVPDFVEGAVQWDAPETQNHLHQLFLRDPAKYPRYRRSAAEVAERRRAAGAREVWVPGVAKTRFWTYA